MATLDYSPVVQTLIGGDRLMALGPGTPNGDARSALAALSLDHAFGTRTVVDRLAANACLAGLWLLHDFLDESHTISQDLETPEGSYWHAIMHRREPDFWNSKYWFRRVGRHPVFAMLGNQSAELVKTAGSPAEMALLADQPHWDPFAFVDLCETASRGNVDEMLCRRIQQLEWELLFDYCYRRAVGE